MIKKREKVSLDPRSLVEHFYNKVKFKTAILVVFLAIIVECIILILMGIPNIANYFLISLFSSFVIGWLFVAVIIYLLVYLIRGKKYIKKDSFEKILSGLASFRIINIFALLFAYLISIVFVPKLLVYIKQMVVNPMLLYSTTSMPLVTGWGTFGLILLYILSVILVIYWFVMFYFLISKIYDTKKWWLIIILIIVIFFVIFLINMLF